MLFIFDWDGTIGGRKNFLSSDSALALKKLKNMGHKVMIATGRHPFEIIHNISDNNVLSDYIIGANGGLIYNRRTKENIWISEIPVDIKTRIIELCKEEKTSLISMYEDKVGVSLDLVPNVYPKYRGYWRDSESYLYKRTNESEILNSKVVLIIIPLGHINNYRIKLNSYIKEFSNVASVSSGDTSNISITNKNINKWTGIQRFMKMMNIQEKTITFGDAHNDLDMIKNADIGIAMGNSQPILKENADHIIGDCDERGILDFVEKIEKDPSFLNSLLEKK